MATAQRHEPAPVTGDRSITNLPLYRLAAELREMLALVAESEGEVSEEQAAQLSAINMAVDDKAEAIKLVVVEKQALIAAIGIAANDLAVRSLRISCEIERLKEYARRCLKEAGITRAEGPRGGFRIQLNPPKVEVDMAHFADEETMAADVPEKFLRKTPEQTIVVPASIAIDKPAILAAVKANPATELPKGIAVVRGEKLVVL